VFIIYYSVKRVESITKYCGIITSTLIIYVILSNFVIFDIKINNSQ